MNHLWTMYIPKYPKILLYMLQASEYDVSDYLGWFHRTRDFRSVMKRRDLVWTDKVKLLAVAELIIVGIICIVAWLLSFVWIPLALLPFVFLPAIMAYGVVIPLLVGRIIIQDPQERHTIARARQKLAAHSGLKIAIVGSYGKTTAKEVLRTVLSEKYAVAATPGNMNTLMGISRFIESLDGTEEILIFEMGESHVGDIRQLCELVQPDMGVITGINQAHLQSFGSIDNTIATIFELREYLGSKPLYGNGDDALVSEHFDDDSLLYGKHGTKHWGITDKNVSLDGTSFTIQKKNRDIKAKTGLIGEHTLGVLALAVAIGEKMNMTDSQIAAGLADIVPFEHRMQLRRMHGASIIDDTYNGNIQGVEVGLALLKKSNAKRRIYVTPGLVEQGDETKNIHINIGMRIADSADVVVLMRNSVTTYIQEGLEQKKFTGKIEIVDEPLHFYTNLEHYVAAGDVVLMQNDWTDNYE